MAKNKRHPWLKGIVGSWIGWQSVKYVSQHPHFLRDLKYSVKAYAQAISDFVDSLQSLRLNMAQVRVELKKSEKTLNEIQQSVDRFQYKLKPRMAKLMNCKTILATSLTKYKRKLLIKKENEPNIFLRLSEKVYQNTNYVMIDAEFN